MTEDNTLPGGNDAAVESSELKEVGFPVKATFGFEQNLVGAPIPDTMFMPGYDRPHPMTPPLIPHYKFDKEMFFHLSYFLLNPMGQILLLSGPPGCGKSSGPEQLAARLHRPVTRVTAHEKMLIDDLIIRYVPDGHGHLKPVDGPLTMAIREGHIFILDEPDALPPGELIGLNGLRDNGRLVIPQTGEVVERHSWFRMVYTANTNGSGDSSGLFAGVKRQNAASLDGTRCVLCTYPAPAVEVEILEGAAPQLVQTDLIAKMVDLANQLRRLFSEGGHDTGVSLPFSTRSLVDWARSTVQYRMTPTPLQTALALSYTNRLDEAERAAVMEAGKLVFGELWK